MAYNLSQEEINQLIKEAKDYTDDPNQLEFNLSKTHDHVEIETCIFHTWEKYEGLRESFIHCKLCGEKKND